MGVALTAVPATMDVTVIDGNFGAIETLFRGGVLKADIADRIDRFRITEYVSGLVVAQSIFANPFRTSKSGMTDGAMERLEFNYRAETEDPSDPANSRAREFTDSMSASAMELLGLPGPSFYYSFQEDGLQDPATISPGITGWPVTGWPYDRYPRSRCYSRWLTAYGATIRTYVPQRCIARIKGHVKGAFNIWTMARYYNNLSGGQDYNAASHRYDCWQRFGLVADTNPVLYTDEFGNANRWIQNPDGTQADYCSFKIVSDRTLRCASRENIQLWGEVELQGRRSYNFSLKYREAGHYGWINRSANAWVNGLWEQSHLTHPAVVNRSVLSPRFQNPTVNDLNGFHPPWLTLIESSGIEVEFYYGVGYPRRISNLHADFDTIFRPVN